MAEIKQNPQAKPPKKRWWLLGIVIVVIAGLAGLYLWHGYQNSTPTYKNLSSYKVTNSQGIAGMRINVPADFKRDPSPSFGKAKVTITPAQANFSQHKNIGNQDVAIARLSINSLPYIKGTAPANPDLISSQLGKPGSPGYSAALLPLQAYVQKMLNPNYPKTSVYKLSYGNAKVLSTANIHKNAWLLTFTAQASTPQSQYPDMRGEAVVVYGQKGTYYLAFASTTEIWQKNQAVWQQILDSLEVDQ